MTRFNLKALVFARPDADRWVGVLDTYNRLKATNSTMPYQIHDSTLNANIAGMTVRGVGAMGIISDGEIRGFGSDAMGLSLQEWVLWEGRKGHWRSNEGSGNGIGAMGCCLWNGLWAGLWACDLG